MVHIDLGALESQILIVQSPDAEANTPGFRGLRQEHDTSSERSKARARGEENRV